MEQRRILIKLTGNLLKHTAQGVDTSHLKSIAWQVKKLSDSMSFGIVVGGGKLFRGSEQSDQAGISQQTGHLVGMIATMINGLIVQDVFEQTGIETALFSAIPCDLVGVIPSPQALSQARKEKRCLIFVGGTGNPYFSTDTSAVVRALQMEAHELWKGTKVDGIYSEDPLKNPAAELIKHISYKKALDENLTIMDSASYALAEEHNLPLRIFNIFIENALIEAAYNKEFGSIIGQT
jgi:uridylate kinase